MRLYARAARYFRPDLPQVMLSLLLIGLATLLGLLQPFPLAILIDSVIQGARPNQWVYRLFFRFCPTHNQLSQIMILAAITLLLRIAQELLQMIQTFLSIRIGYHGLLRIRCDLFRKLQELSLGYHRAQPQGDAIYRLSSDTFGLQGLFNVLIGILTNVLTLVLMVAFMWSLDWRLTLISLAVAPPLLATIQYYSRVFKDRSLAAREVDSRLTTVIQRSVASIGLVQAFGREADEYARFQNTAASSIGAYLRLHRQEVMYLFLIGVIFGVGGAAIFGYGGYRIYAGAMSVGSLTIYLAYLVKLYEPLNKLSYSGMGLQAGAAGVQRVFEVLDRDNAIADAPGAIDLPRQPRMLELDRVGFEYRPGEAVLRDVSVKIQSGQMVAFVGSSGVGKTTLLNLLPRFYDPTSGALRLDGHDLRKIKLRDLRRHIALVLQEGTILPASVAENIAYGRPDAPIGQIRRAAELAGAAAFIDKLPNKFDTQVSESGQNLSGGQRQRIAIARALLSEAPILIFDEPTSALDAQNEWTINQTLLSLRGRHTIILVSHRLSTVADCDQIFVMDEGRIVEQGRHDQLVARGGLYSQMARHQMKPPADATPVG